MSVSLKRSHHSGGIMIKLIQFIDGHPFIYLAIAVQIAIDIDWINRVLMVI